LKLARQKTYLPKGEKQLAGLTDEQKAVAKHKNGPLLVIAGPGSGKTHTIIHRVAALINDGDARADEILAITFTRKAAGEMRERVSQLIEEANQPFNIYTFHGFGARIIRDHYNLFGFETGLSIFDEADQIGVIKQALRDLTGASAKNNSVSYKNVKAFISDAKNSSKSPEAAALSALDSDELNLQIYKRYEEILAAANAVDFDDLLLKPNQMFEQDPETARAYQSQFKYILVDEFQDTNRLQLEMCLHIANAERKICAVGDPNQSIYAWRHAELSNILNFQRFFPNATVCYLSQSFRSTGKLLDSANELISHNKTSFKPVKL